MFAFLFFFQAEDGIRYLVRSRGLGDVYKRQAYARATARLADIKARLRKDGSNFEDVARGYSDDTVSYTHLTLPTSDLV